MSSDNYRRATVLTLRLQITEASRQSCKNKNTYSTPLSQEPWGRGETLPTERLEEQSLAHPSPAFGEPSAWVGWGSTGAGGKELPLPRNNCTQLESVPSRPALHPGVLETLADREADPHRDCWVLSGRVHCGSRCPTERLLCLSVPAGTSSASPMSLSSQTRASPGTSTLMSSHT